MPSLQDLAGLSGGGKDATIKKDTGAPFRHPLEWQDPKFYDKAELEKEMRRVFEICNGCRLCFNLCNSFPKLFELVDKTKSQALDEVPSTQFKGVVDDCTLCDMCFVAKCPYVPPHPFNIDFPHLMLRYRIVENNQAPSISTTTSSQPSETKKEQPSSQPEPATASKPSKTTKKEHTIAVDRSLQTSSIGFFHKLMVDMDRFAPIASFFAPLTNFATSNALIRKLVLSNILGIHEKADLPQYVSPSKTFLKQSQTTHSSLPNAPNPAGPSFGKRKAVLYATCLVNYNKPNIGQALRSILLHNGVEVVVEYPQCCGMPQLESGDVKDVTARATNVANKMKKFIDDGYDVVALTPSCALMLKQEWPNYLPNDANVQLLAKKTMDASEYVVSIAKKEGLIQGLQPLPHGVTLHHACHARAQNMGFKARDMLKLIPQLNLSTVERCSGHGGSFGTLLANFETATKVGKPIVTKIQKDLQKDQAMVVSSECPLAGDHIKQGVRDAAEKELLNKHPVELMAMSYGFQIK